MEGICGSCGSKNIEYSAPEYGVVTVDYPFVCLSCDSTGSEIFDMTYCKTVMEVQK